MAWFVRNKKEDYGRTGNSDHVHHPVILDSDGRKHPVVGYTATHNSHTSYVAKTEQVVRYQNVPGFLATRDYQKYSPPRKEVYKDHGDGDKPHPMPRISGHDWPEKTSESPPKARDEVVHRPGKNSAWNNGYRDYSPPISNDQYRTSHHDYGKHDNFNTKTNSKYHDDEEDDDVICNDGVCFENPRKWSKPNHFNDENYNENEKHKENGYSPSTYTVPISTQQKRDAHYKTPHINTAINNNNSDKKEKGNNHSTHKFPSITKQPRSRDQVHQETIDSSEARRRYGVAMPGAGTGSGYDEEKYARTIDSNEAARIYNGVFLSN